MRYIRMLLSFFLSAFLLLALPLTAYAGTASGSDAQRVPVASSSDADRPLDDFVESDPFDDIPPDDIYMDGPTGLAPVENTVNLTGVYVMLHYYDMSGVVRTKGVQCESDGHFRFDRPSDYASIYAVGVDVRKAALPSPGKYSVAINCHTNAGGSSNYKQFYVGSNKNNANASTQSGLEPVDGLYNYSEFGYRGTVNLGVVYDYFIHVLYDNTQPFGFGFDGYIKVNFTKLGADANVGYDTPGSGTASEDLQQNMADNSNQQVAQGNTIIELIKNTIQTISSQLTAFWNQLAGEFTNLYNKLNQHHSEDLAKVDEQISADRQNTDDLISNQDKNTDTMVNGYDNSGMNSDNDRLNSSLTEYGQAEDNLMGDVNKHIGSIDFDYSFDSIVSVVGSVSDFFQGIYERSGQFQIVINVCLILSLASCAVGIYRLKGGG